jgi:hypothetical protein
VHFSVGQREEGSANPVGEDGLLLHLLDRPPGRSALGRAGLLVGKPLNRDEGTERLSAEWRAAVRTEEQVQARLLRDILGNPFRPIAVDPAWRTSSVRGQAHALYEDRQFEEMPILADALEEGGAKTRTSSATVAGQGNTRVAVWSSTCFWGRGEPMSVHERKDTSLAGLVRNRLPLLANPLSGFRAPPPQTNRIVTLLCQRGGWRCLRSPPGIAVALALLERRSPRQPHGAPDPFGT